MHQSSAGRKESKQMNVRGVHGPDCTAAETNTPADVQPPRGTISGVHPDYLRPQTHSLSTFGKISEVSRQIVWMLAALLQPNGLFTDALRSPSVQRRNGTL